MLKSKYIYIIRSKHKYLYFRYFVQICIILSVQELATPFCIEMIFPVYLESTIHLCLFTHRGSELLASTSLGFSFGLIQSMLSKVQNKFHNIRIFIASVTETTFYVQVYFCPTQRTIVLSLPPLNET